MIPPYILGFYNLRDGLRYAIDWIKFSLIKNKDVEVKLEILKKKKNPENRVINLNEFNKIG